MKHTKEKLRNHMRFEVLAAVEMHMVDIWVVTQSELVSGYSIHLQG
jgi:hypothetical protein